MQKGSKMDKLVEGVIKFSGEYFEKHKEHFKLLASKQTPHTLFISCSDSRVVPDIIAHTKPGELFVVRNIGNMVPPKKDDINLDCTPAIIEYAVGILEVENIVVCGHTDCGGCKALYYPDEKLNHFPKTKNWLQLGKEVKERVLSENLPKDRIPYRTEKLNVLKQVEHLFTYPFIKEKVNSGKLNVYGWYYVIENGDVFNYNPDTKHFELIKDRRELHSFNSIVPDDYEE
jgi:carbonic anhydrase